VLSFNKSTDLIEQENKETLEELGPLGPHAVLPCYDKVALHNYNLTCKMGRRTISIAVRAINSVVTSVSLPFSQA